MSALRRLVARQLINKAVQNQQTMVTHGDILIPAKFAMEPLEGYLTGPKTQTRYPYTDDIFSAYAGDIVYSDGILEVYDD